MSNNILPSLASLLPRLPILLVCIAGIALALANWRNHRTPAIFVLCGSAALLLGFLLGSILNVMAVTHTQSGRSAQEIANLFAVVGIFQSLLSATGYALLLVAAFIGRNRPPLPPTI